jgi:hemerythrin
VSQTFLEWTAELELGVPDLDTQHRRLLNLVNRCAWLIDLPAGVRFEEASAALADLLGEARSHFDFEEALMRESGYCARVLHCEQHAELLGSMERLLDQLARDRLGANERQMPTFLREWFVAHVARSDRQLAEFLKGHANAGDLSPAGLLPHVQPAV